MAGSKTMNDDALRVFASQFADKPNKLKNLALDFRGYLVSILMTSNTDFS